MKTAVRIVLWLCYFISFGWMWLGMPETRLYFLVSFWLLFLLLIFV